MKSLSFHCPHCNQHIEAGPEWAGKNLECPNCQKFFIVPAPAPRHYRPSIVFIIILGIVGFIAWAFHHSTREFEADLDSQEPITVSRMMDQAEPAMLQQCSNHLGFSRILDHYTDVSDPEITNWHGNATIDYINKQGGFERTNILFRFFKGANRCLCLEDEYKEWQRQVAHEEMDAEIRRKADLGR